MNFVVSILVALIAVSILVLIPWVGVGALDLRALFGIVIPYAAFATFIIGIIVRVIGWARAPVPFRIPTTAGQQKTHPWIKHARLDNPSTTLGVVGRMIFEVLTFRSLFRNTRMEFREGPKIDYEWEKWLWLFALGFHYAFLVVVIRHMRFFTEPIPYFVHLTESLDGFLEMGLAPIQGVGVPGIMISGFVLLGAATLLLLRRIIVSNVRYISLPADYFPLFLILAIGTTGVLMRYHGILMYRLIGLDLLSADIVRVKELAMGLVTFHPVVPQGIGAIFFIHLFLVCVLLAYFPFSKLMHLGGVFLSPTRNLSNTSRTVHHVNPWNYPVKVHTYEEYEDEFRDKMVEVGLPVEKMPETPGEGEAASEEENKE